MKKTIATIAAIAIASSLATAIPTFAAEYTPTEVAVSATYASSYTVTIPDDAIDLTNDSGSIAISAENVILEQDQTLSVNVVSANGFKLANGKGDEVAYKLTKGADVVTEATPVLTVTSGADAATLDVSIAEGASAQYAGTYSDTLTFTVAINE